MQCTALNIRGVESMHVINGLGLGLVLRLKYLKAFTLGFEIFP